MKTIYKTKKKTKIILLIIILSLIILPPLAGYYFAKTYFEFLLISGIIITAYSPIIILLSILLYRYHTIKIITDSEGLFYKSSKRNLKLNWKEIININFDYMEIKNSKSKTSQYYTVYQIESEKNKLRFFVYLGKNRKHHIENYSNIKNLGKKRSCLKIMGCISLKKMLNHC